MKWFILFLFMTPCIIAQDLDDFEDDLDDDDTEEDDDDGGVFAELFAQIIVSMIEEAAKGISKLPSADYGKYPYSLHPKLFYFNEDTSQQWTPWYNDIGMSYQHTNGGIQTINADYRTVKNSFLFQFNAQYHREELLRKNPDHLLMTQTRIGFIKLIPERSVWSSYTGISTIHGKKGHGGMLIGSGLKIYYPWPVTTEAEGTLHFYGKGRWFFDRKLSLSFFHKRFEFQGGYQWMETWNNHQLNGPFLGVKIHL